MVKFNNFDFISKPPNFLIFQGEANKTNFGGVLFLLYIIIMAFISLGYILDYIMNAKYEIETSIYKYFPDDKIKPPPNPDIDIEITVFLEENDNVSDRLYILEKSEKQNTIFGTYRINVEEDDYISYSMSYHITGKKLNSHFNLYYLVNRSEMVENDDYYYQLPYIDSVEVTSKTCRIENGASNPLQKSADYEHFSDYPIFIEIGRYQTFYANIHWTSIVYQEKQGISRLFNNLRNITSRHTGGNLDKDKSEILYLSDLLLEDCTENGEEKCIFVGTINFFQTEYFEYNRKKIEFTDIIAKIGALFSTFNYVFSFIYKFYSKNFDKYKIKEELLQCNDLYHNNIKINCNEFKNIFNINSPLLDDIQEKDKDKKINFNKNKKKDKLIPLDKDKSNKEQNTLSDNNSDDDNQDIIASENNIKNINLPKLSFFDFFIENIYCKICRRNRKQEIIKQCNNIISKYISIDSLLIYLMKLENLFIDYKWNNPELNNLQNNELLKNLKIKYIDWRLSQAFNPRFF